MNTALIAVEKTPAPRMNSRVALALPPVIVLNLFHSGLGIARQLAGRGVRVVGLSSHPRIYGNSTRLCEVRPCPSSQEQPEKLTDFLLHCAPDLRNAIIFPTSDADLLFLDRYRRDLELFYRLAIPPHRVLGLIMDKPSLARVAAQAEIPIPRTAVVTEESQLAQGAGLVGFPCVVKPVTSVTWRQGKNWAAVGGRKAFRANSLAELKSEYRRVSQASPETLLQEWIPGETGQLVTWGGYVGQGSEPIAYFTARKIVQSPEEFGTGCIVESDHIPELLEPSVRLCRSLGYEGMADIEYKYDARDGKFKLIELNPRHWDWHQLSEVNGINLSWLAYRHLNGMNVRPRHPDVDVRNTKWIAEDSLLEHTLSDLYRRRVHPIELGKQLQGRRMYSIFAWNDPVPFLRYTCSVLFPKFARSLAGRIWNGYQ